MSGLVLTVTDAGRAALVNAANNGTAPVLMAAVGISATTITPTPNASTLPGEIKRISTLSGEAVADDTIHVTIRDESADTYTVRALALYLEDGTLFGLYGQADPIMEKSAQAMLLLAIDVAFADLDAQQISFGDTSFLLPPATTERPGVVELATSAETISGTDAIRAVTPKGLKAAITSWLDDRFGAGAPSAFVKSLLTAASAAALRTALGIKSAALKDEGPGQGLDADTLDGQHASAFAPASHNHAIDNIPGLQAALDAKLNASSYTAADVKAKILTQDGSGSGLDADLLDGLHASSFLRATSAHGYATYAIDNVKGNYYGLLHGTSVDCIASMFTSTGLGGWYQQSTSKWLLYWDGAQIYVGSSSGNKVWHAGNDGSGSGLDADTVDGMHASAFAAASHSHAIANISGLQAALDAKLASSSYTAADVMAKMLTVDGSGSGLDADLLDGLHASSFARITSASSSSSGGYRVYADGFKECWGVVSASGNTSTLVAYPIAFSSWSRAICTGGRIDSGAQDNGPFVSSTTTGGLTIYNSIDSATSTMWRAWGY